MSLGVVASPRGHAPTGNPSDSSRSHARFAGFGGRDDEEMHSFDRANDEQLATSERRSTITKAVCGGEGDIRWRRRWRKCSESDRFQTIRCCRTTRESQVMHVAKKRRVAGVVSDHGRGMLRRSDVYL
jgi:hypothetical protein